MVSHSKATVSAKPRNTKPPKGMGTVKSRRTATAVLTMANRQAIAEINSELRASPEKILGCLMAVRGNLFLTGKHGSTNKSRQLDKEVPWPTSYTTIGQLPRAWMCPFLQLAEPGFTDEVLALVSADSGDTVKRLIYFATGLHDGSGLPKECLNKSVCSRWFIELYKNLGQRFRSEWVRHHLNAKGEVDWNSGGVYCWKSAPEDNANLIQHITGATGKPRVCLESEEDTAIAYNWSDWDAQLAVIEVKCYKCLANRGADFEAFLSDQRDLAKDIFQKKEDMEKEESARSVVVSSGTQKALQKPKVSPVKVARSPKPPPEKPCPRPKCKAV